MNFDTARHRMVDEQLVVRGIKNPKVLDVFRKVPRHKFVTEKFAPASYADHPLSIGEGQTISQPYMVALMTEQLALTGVEKVLEIGTGSGYQAAILAELSKEVYSVERLAPIAEHAKSILSELGYAKVKIKTGDGTKGWEEFGPYDRIIVTAGSPKIPDELVKQLKVGGKMIIPVGGSFSQMLTLVEKTAKGVSTTGVCACVFVPLIGEGGWRG